MEESGKPDFSPPSLASSRVHTPLGCFSLLFVQEGIPLILHVSLHCSLPNSVTLVSHVGSDISHCSCPWELL